MPIRLQCPGCKRQLKVPEKFAGQKGPCPSCGTELLVPRPTLPRPPVPGRSPQWSPLEWGFGIAFGIAGGLLLFAAAVLIGMMLFCGGACGLMRGVMQGHTGPAIPRR